MRPRRLTTSQLLAGAVPFLLVLIALPIAPRIITTVHNHFVSAPTTTQPREPSTTVPTHHVTTTSAPRSITTTTNVAGSATTTVSKEKLSATANDPNGIGSDTSGFLTPPYSYADEGLADGTTWTLSATGTLVWALYCGGVKINDSPQPIAVPLNGGVCYVEIRSNQNTMIQWLLSPVS
jgi:hypothetical protein